MPNIKGIKTDNMGNIEITPTVGIKHNLVRTELIKLTEDKDTGLANTSKTGYDVYTHRFEDISMINTKRTAVLVCNKGYVPRKEWWITEEESPVIGEVIK